MSCNFVGILLSGDTVSRQWYSGRGASARITDDVPFRYQSAVRARKRVTDNCRYSDPSVVTILTTLFSFIRKTKHKDDDDDGCLSGVPHVMVGCRVELLVLDSSGLIDKQKDAGKFSDFGFK